MKVAILKINFNSYGGSEKYCLLLTHYLLQKGHTPVIFSSSKVPGLDSNLIHEVPTIKFNKFLRLYSFNQYISSHFKNNKEFDAIISMDKTMYHTHIRAGGGCHKAWLLRKEKLCSWWEKKSLYINPYHKLVLKLEKLGFEGPWVKEIITNSNMVKREILEHYKVDENKIVVIHNAVEWKSLEKAFWEKQNKDDLRKALKLDSDSFYFLFVGNGFERKGLKFAIESLRQFPKDIKLIVVGYDKNINKYKKFAQSLKLSDRVLFAGYQPNVVKFYQVADAFLLPTLYDPFSNASLEALAMGLFVVTTKDNGCSEVIEDFSGVVIEDPTEVDSLVYAMKLAISKEKDPLKIRMSVAHLDMDEQVKKFLKACLLEI
jgi:UDP-glucose:(heptosyl)LPS alpha-1,3-glucosyltransferase